MHFVVSFGCLSSAEKNDLTSFSWKFGSTLSETQFMYLCTYILQCLNTVDWV